jgi:hypothetical protein
MKDPLSPPDGPALFAEIGKLVAGAPLNIVRDIAVSLLLNSIRQGTAKRSDAEAAINEIFNRAKSLLLDLHYDSVSGNRKAIYPYTQVISPPLHIDERMADPSCGR